MQDDRDERQVMEQILSDWLEVRHWAGNLLMEQFGGATPFEAWRSIPREKFGGENQFPDMDWKYCPHGIGINVYQDSGRDVDFDFDHQSAGGFKRPDSWRLWLFAKGEVKAKRPRSEKIALLLHDDEEFRRLAHEIIESSSW